jgi:hypothetical protein
VEFLRPPAASKEPEAGEDDEFISFSEAILITNLTSSELSRASRPGGPVRSKGHHRGKLVHELDARRYADGLSRRRREGRK